MRAPQRLLPLLAGLILVACSSDDGTGPEPAPTTTASATIQPKGGSLVVEAENGTSLKVTFPALAVTAATHVTLRSVDPPAGVKARFAIEPAGLDLNQAITFKVTYPDGKSPGAQDGLIFTSGEAIHVPAVVDAVNHTLTATLYHLGFDLPAPVALDAIAPLVLREDDNSEFIDVEAFECDFIRESLDNQILRAQAFVGAFPPSLATPLIQQYKAALLACLSPDSISAASAALNEYACSNVTSADAEATTSTINTADDLEKALGALVAAEGISETVGSTCSVQTESIDLVFDKFITAYHDRITAPGFTRSVSDWDDLWKELQTVLRVKALADEFEVFRAQQRIQNTLFPALYGIVREVASTACDEDEDNSFLLDLLKGGHPLHHPMTAVPEFPSFTGFTQSDVVDEVLTCGSSFLAEAKTSSNELLGTSEITSGTEGSVRAPAAGKLIITNHTLGHLCSSILTRGGLRVRAERQEQLPVVELGTLNTTLAVNIQSVIAALPAPTGGPATSFDVVIERDRNVCGIDEQGVKELARIHVDAQGFSGSMAGGWSGNCTSGAVSGTFAIVIGSNGEVTGTFDGSATGSITGTVSANGTFDATANGTAGGCSWQGTLNLDSGAVSVAGTWTCGGDCSGGFAGTGAPATARSR